MTCHHFHCHLPHRQQFQVPLDLLILELDKNMLLYLLFLSSVSPQTAKRRILLNERTSLQKEDGEVLRMHFRLPKCHLFFIPPEGFTRTNNLLRSRSFDVSRWLLKPILLKACLSHSKTRVNFNSNCSCCSLQYYSDSDS